ncbi:DoxX family membrane protein [Streptomyces sp. NPDC058572]|uniref:DoxX family membrane protein n=1 Tax=Streptomyces sp. NPDC058572 TaxID=3346546 RepID=UPI003647AF2C
MSVDTRTPRSGFDEQPALSMVKVHCDPAQVIVNHVSFRVQLARKQRPAPVTARLGSLAGAGPGARRRAPVVWSGRSAPGDSGATGLIQAVRNSTLSHDTFNTGATQVMPRIDLDDETVQTLERPAIDHPGGAGHRNRPLLPPMRQAVGAYDSYPTASPDPYPAADFNGPNGSRPNGSRPYDSRPYAPHPYASGHTQDQEPCAEEEFEVRRPQGAPSRFGADTVRHAYYPGRRMNLGVVLLPLRVFLGFISICAGMGKLCDPVYFEGGERGSMVKWLHSLHPWGLAEPLRDFALSHPVGAGLSVAFLQIVVGVLTVLGLWQRVAAVVGALLSAALILTVTWRTVPVYDAPDIIFLAAWSPLIIAGAPVYSVDGRLAGEAWRTLGPRSELWDLRRRVLIRGSLVAAVVVGLTMLVGSMLGGAVRSTEMVTVPGPGQDPTNHLPGSPLAQESAERRRSSSGTRTDRPAPSTSGSATPEAEKSTPAKDTVRETGRVGEAPSQTQGTGRQPPTGSQPAPPPSSSSGPTSSGGTGTGGGSTGGGSTGGSGGSGGGTGGSGGSGGSSGGQVIGGLLG